VRLGSLRTQENGLLIIILPTLMRLKNNAKYPMMLLINIILAEKGY
jgi:hypothetical protein